MFVIFDLLQGAKSIFCTLYGVWGDDFHKKFQVLEFFFAFYFVTFNFLILLLLHETLNGSWNIQGFALIRAVLFRFVIVPFESSIFKRSFMRAWSPVHALILWKKVRHINFIQFFKLNYNILYIYQVIAKGLFLCYFQFFQAQMAKD